MPQKSEFRVLPDRLGAAGEQIASCRSKAEGLAEQLAEIQRGLKGSASSVGQLEHSVAVLQEDIRNQAKRMDQAAETALFSAVRYSNAERGILGQPLLAFSSSAADTKKAAGSGAGSSGGTGSGNSSGKETGKKTKPAVSKGGPSVGPGAAAGAAAAGMWIDRYHDSKSGWTGTTYKNSDESYISAYVRTKTGPDGTEEKTVSAYLGKTSTQSSVSFLNASSPIGSYKVSGDAKGFDKFAGKIADLEKQFNNKYSYNTFRKKDPADPTKDQKGDWSGRVWESQKVPADPSKPNGPAKTRMQRHLTEEDKLRNSFSKDITGAKLVQWNKEATASVAGVSVSKEGKHTSGSASLSVFTATAAASAGAGVYYVVKDGKKVLAYGADAKVGASASVIKADASGKAGYAPDALKDILGKDFNLVGVEGAAEGKVGHVEANAGAKARIVDGKLELAAEGDAGAYAVKGSVSGRANLLGVKVGGSLEGNVGVGVSGKIGLTGGKLRCEFGLSVGLGFKAKFDIDVQGAVDAVKNGVTKAAAAVANVAKSVSDSVWKVGKSIGSFLSKW